MEYAAVPVLLFCVIICVVLLKPIPKVRTAMNTLVLDNMRFDCPMHIEEDRIRTFHPLKAWQESIRLGLLAHGATLEKIIVRDAFMFGPRIGFLFMEVNISLHGVRLPGAVVLRGPSVAVLIWYREWITNRVHVVLVCQPRVAVGRMTWEVPAGMIDKDGTLQGQMFKEIEEETGLVVHISDLKHHAFTHPQTSPGLLDEYLELYSVEITQDVMDRAKTRSRLGNVNEGEVITKVEGIPLDDVRVMEDAKLRVLLSTVH